MQNVAIIDADIIGRKKHRFPNLASMKLSAWHKNVGDNVTLEWSYDNVNDYDVVYVSKVFTDTKVPNGIVELPNVKYGGTGFFYDKAEPLPYEIEHIMPDYHLYDEWIEEMIRGGAKPSQFDTYQNYSIGFLTRGCFRQCEFCVNKNYKQCLQHSSVKEFYDPTRKKMCFLDDNFFACKDWRTLIKDVKEINKPFIFKQGLDERLLTKEKIEEMLSWKYIGRYIFAFDNIADYDLIESKLKLMKSITNKPCTFYVLCGYDYNDKYDLEFWQRDIIDLFRRIELLGAYGHYPYIMRHANYQNSPYKGMYINIATWCNMPHLYAKMSYWDYCREKDALYKNESSYIRYYKKGLEIPNIEKYTKQYFLQKEIINKGKCRK